MWERFARQDSTILNKNKPNSFYAVRAWLVRHELSPKWSNASPSVCMRISASTRLSCWALLGPHVLAMIWVLMDDGGYCLPRSGICVDVYPSCLEACAKQSVCKLDAWSVRVNAAASDLRSLAHWSSNDEGQCEGIRGCTVRGILTYSDGLV